MHSVGRKPGARRDSGLTPLVGGCVGLLAMLVGLYIIFNVLQGSRAHCVHA